MALGIEFKDHHGELWACCPFPDHDEKTASWSIKQNGLHYCFGCSMGGGAIGLVKMVFDFKLSSVAAMWLEENGLFLDGAMPLDIELEMSRPNLTQPQVELPEHSRWTRLDEWVTPARRYALTRGITPEQVDRWGLGYSAGGYYANRILIPTREHKTGRLISITGRAWSPTKTPKYLNSKEAHGWDPGAIFGEYHWGEYLSRSTLVLTEGELNALACERVGAQFVGALGGSTLQKEQVLKLSQFQRVIIAVDIDRAGTQIAEELRATLARWKRTHVVAFPDKRDPNDLEREDPNLLRALLWPTT